MNCLLTGGGGIVGSHIIFEWLYKAIIDKTVAHLFVVIRANEKSAQQRLETILQDASRPKFLNAFTLEACLEKVTVISSDLSTIKKERLEKYISVPDLQFEVEEILKLIKQLKLNTTLSVHENFMNLINFSVEKKFKKSY